MRERLWWLLRRQPLLRRVYERHRQARWVQLVRVLVAPTDRPRWLRVRAGIAAGLRFRLNPRWEHAQWQGDYEPAVQRWLTSRSWRGRRVYDVGAGFGYFALALARAGAEVLACEPDPANFADLERHLARNRLRGWVRPLPLALGAEEGRLRFEPAPQGRGHGNALQRPEGRIEVQVRPLDDLVVEYGPPDLVKIDVEGQEGRVLAGATRTLAEVRPLLLVEVHDDQAWAACRERLERAGYRWSWLESQARWPRHLVAEPVTTP